MIDKPSIDPKVSATNSVALRELVSADVPCLTCEYNLRSLSTKGRCPECGQPVRDTLDRRQLLGQAAMLNELAGFVTTMTVSLVIVTFVLIRYLLSLVTSIGLDLIFIAMIFLPVYYLSAMGGGIDIFRITKRPAFGLGVIVTFVCIIAIELAFLSTSTNPSLSAFIVSLFFSVGIIVVAGTPVWFAQHTKHLASLSGNDKLKSLANITAKICLVLPGLTLFVLGWAAISSITGQPKPTPFQLSSGLMKFAVLTILLAMSISSALLGFRLVAVAKKLHRTAQAIQGQTK